MVLRAVPTGDALEQEDLLGDGKVRVHMHYLPVDLGLLGPL